MGEGGYVDGTCVIPNDEGIVELFSDGESGEVPRLKHVNISQSLSRVLSR